VKVGDRVRVEVTVQRLWTREIAVGPVLAIKRATFMKHRDDGTPDPRNGWPMWSFDMGRGRNTRFFFADDEITVAR
jgi:hypothetical protein